MLTYPERACERLLHIDPNLSAFKQDILLTKKKDFVHKSRVYSQK